MRVRYQSEPEVSGLWAIPHAAPVDAATLYVLGGAAPSSSPLARRKLAGHLALATGARVLVPRCQFDVGRPLADATAGVVRTFNWLLAGGFQAERTVIAADFSGASATLAGVMHLARRGEPVPAGMVLLSPWTDFQCRGASYRSQGRVDACLRRQDLRRLAVGYAVDRPAIDVTHLFANASNVPPLLIIAGGDELLLGDAMTIARGGIEARVDTTLYVGAGMQHLFPLYVGAMPEATRAVSRIGRWTNEVTHAAGAGKELATYDPD
jgi:acetyl esterase/lipase